MQFSNKFRTAGGTGMAGSGCALTLCALAIIVICWINRYSNKRQMEEHPIITALRGGDNLNKMAYTFLPPYTAFEIVVICVLLAGVALLLFSGRDNDSKKAP